MRKALVVAAALILVAAPSCSRAAADVVVCPLETAISNLRDYTIGFEANLAGQMEPILEEIGKLSAKGTNPNLPIGKQLSSTDLLRFQQLREQMLTLQARKIVHSAYVRDSNVIAQTAKVAFDISRGRTFSESDPQYFYYSVVSVLSLQHPPTDVKVTVPEKPDDCTVEAGLHFYEQLMNRELQGLPFQPAFDRLKAVAAKYKLDMKQEGWIERIPSPKEKASAKIDNGTLKRAFQIDEYVNNIENLKALNHVAVLGYWSDTNDIDIAHNEAELSKVGTTWPEKAKKYDERTQILSGLLNMIAEKIPSDSMIETQGRAKRLREQGIIH